LNTPTLVTPRPIPALLEDTVRNFPSNKAITFLGRSWTYRELDTAVTRATAGLQRIGVKQGTRVGLCLPNSPYSVIFFFATLRAGGIVVNYNPLYVERELVHQITDSGTEVMVTLDVKAIYPKVVAVAARTGLKKIVVCSMADALPWLKGVALRVAKRAELAPIVKDDVSVAAATLLRAGPPPTAVPIDPNDTAVLQYTGGTTGVPKGAELTHANLTCNAMQCWLGLAERPHGQDRVLGVLPLFHVFALTSVMIVGVQTASEMILVPRFELQQVLALIGSAKPTVFPAVPTIYSAMVEAAQKGHVDLASIQTCMSGGAPLPAEVRTRFMALTGCWLMEGYGLSETSPVVSFTPPGRTYKEGSIGLPVTGTTIEIRAVDDPTRIVPQGERGEICIRGPQVMRGYWNRPEETARVMIDGALRTGDVGYLDEEGYLFLVDRIKDVILCGGYNVYPRILEEALYQHPAVKDCSVIGVPDKYRGQAPKAFVTLKDGMVTTPEELRTFLGDYVSKIEMPREVEIRDELPKTFIGKLSKKELVAEEVAKAEG
jgi:long-chain acyl-CoA synthetase